MADPLDPPVPLEVTRLDYLGREPEIWSEPNDEQRLHATVADIAATWERVRQRLDAMRDGRIVTQVDGLVSHLPSAQSASQYRTLAHQLLDAVDRLEVRFKAKR